MGGGGSFISKLDPTGGNFLGLGSGPGRLLGDIATGGLAEFGRKDPWIGLPGAVADTWRKGTGNSVPQQAVKGGPIYGTALDPRSDAAEIQGLGQANYNENANILDRNYNSFNRDQALINQTGQSDLAARAAARDQLSNLLQQQAQQTFKQSLPQTAEDYNAGGLLNSTGYQQEVARQQANLASGIANQLAQVGLNDVNLGSQYKQAGLNNALGQQDYMRQGLVQNAAARQAMNQAALQRAFSLTDFGNSANVASIIGAQNAPNVGNGKAGTGTMLSGAGSLASGIGALK